MAKFCAINKKDKPEWKSENLEYVFFTNCKLFLNAFCNARIFLRVILAISKCYLHLKRRTQGLVAFKRTPSIFWMCLKLSLTNYISLNSQCTEQSSSRQTNPLMESWIRRCFVGSLLMAVVQDNYPTKTSPFSAEAYFVDTATCVPNPQINKRLWPLLHHVGISNLDCSSSAVFRVRVSA
jgi:hypothetical protein